MDKWCCHWHKAIMWPTTRIFKTRSRKTWINLHNIRKHGYFTSQTGSSHISKDKYGDIGYNVWPDIQPWYDVYYSTLVCHVTHSQSDLHIINGIYCIRPLFVLVRLFDLWNVFSYECWEQFVYTIPEEIVLLQLYGCYLKAVRAIAEIWNSILCSYSNS